LPRSRASLATLPRCIPQAIPRPDSTATSSSPTSPATQSTTAASIRKTGLGSSAALVTSLTAALLLYSHPRLPLPRVEQCPDGSHRRSSEPTTECDEARDVALSLVHNCAQAAHCMAQGKIGSGFDVSTAVYGSQQYCKFSESVLTPLITQVRDPSTNPMSGAISIRSMTTNQRHEIKLAISNRIESNRIESNRMEWNRIESDRIG